MVTNLWRHLVVADLRRHLVGNLWYYLLSQRLCSFLIKYLIVATTISILNYQVFTPDVIGLLASLTYFFCYAGPLEQLEKVFAEQNSQYIDLFIGRLQFVSDLAHLCLKFRLGLV